MAPGSNISVLWQHLARFLPKFAPCSAAPVLCHNLCVMNGAAEAACKVFFVTINSLSIIKKIVTQDYCHSTSATCWLNSFFQCKHFQIVFYEDHKSSLYTWILTRWTFRGLSLIITIWTPWLLRRTSDTSRMGSSPGLLVSDWIIRIILGQNILS